MTSAAAPKPPAARDRRRERRVRRRRRLAFALLGLAFVGGAAGGAWWWFGDHRGAAGATAEPTYLAVTPKPYQVTVPAPGTLRAAATHEVRTQSAGTVVWSLGLGDRVATGEPVARLDPTDLARDVRDAELALERSERSLGAARADRTDVERSLTDAVTEAARRLDQAHTKAHEAAAKLDLTSRLAAVGGVAPRELADAEAAHASARDEVARAERDLAAARADLETRIARAERDLADAIAAVEQARVKLERAEEALEAAVVRAPFDAVVSEVRIAPGGFAGGNATLLVLADDRTLELVAQVDETEIGLIGVGQPARVTILALAQRAAQATVTAVAPAARTAQNIPVFEIVLALDNADGAMLPGMTGEAEVVVRHEADTVTLPAAAVTRNPRGDGIVTVLLEDGETERRQVEVVATVGASLVVRGDLPAGTEVEIPAAAATPTAAPQVVPTTNLSRDVIQQLVPRDAPTGSRGPGGGSGGGGGGQ